MKKSKIDDTRSLHDAPERATSEGWSCLRPGGDLRSDPLTRDIFGSPLPEDEGSELIRRAHTNPDYARLLCFHMANALYCGIAPPVSIMKFFYEAFRRIGNGEDAGKVLGTIASNNPGHLYRDRAIAIDYHKLLPENPNKRDRIDVRDTVAKKWKLSGERVIKIAKRYENEARVQITLRNALRAFAAEDRAGGDDDGPRASVLERLEDEHRRIHLEWLAKLRPRHK